MDYKNVLFIGLLFFVMLVSCTKDSESDDYTQTLSGQQFTVAVVAPLSDAAMKIRLERTAQWFLDNFNEAQSEDTLPIRLQIEWHDEQTEALDTLGSQLAGRGDVAAVVGPFDNERMAQLAPYCQRTLMPLIAPTTTSEDVLRRYAVASAGADGKVNKKAFFWPLCQSDVTLTETMLGHYVTQMGKYAQMGNLNCAFFSPDSKHGQTFFEWAPFFADKMDVDLLLNQQYASTEGLLQQMTQYLDQMEINLDALLSNNFCIVEDEQQLYEVAQMRHDWMIRKDGGNPDAPSWDSKWQALEATLRTWFVCQQLSEEGLAALGAEAVKSLQGYQGFTPYADYRTGFEKDYRKRYGVCPTFAECKLYDALLLVALAAHHPLSVFHPSLNASIYAIAERDNNSDVEYGEPMWRADGLRNYISSMRDGLSPKHTLCGAAGSIAFDRMSCRQLARTAYVHWQISDGHILHPTYYGPDGKQVADTTVSGNIFFDEETATMSFANMAADSDYGIDYPPLSEQYAVLVQGSCGMANYRHQSDVLAMYQLLRRGGFDDDHIILIIDTALANSQQNNEPGVIRGGTDFADLLGGSDADKGYFAATVDYDNADITPTGICQILKQLPSAANILFYWSGHGRNTDHGGVNELVWRDTEAGQGMTFYLLQQTVEQMPLRKMLVILEPCYSEGVAWALRGQVGVLAMTGASGNEQSWAEHWNPCLGQYGTWMCDRFTLNVVKCLEQNPAATYRDLYLYCMSNTIGSHVRMVNADNFGNLYRSSPEEFFIRIK